MELEEFMPRYFLLDHNNLTAHGNQILLESSYPQIICVGFFVVKDWRGNYCVCNRWARENRR